MDMEKMYAALEAQETEKRKVDEEAAKDFQNPNMLTMKAGNTYRVRLMYWCNDVPGDRKVPIIEKTVHAVKTDTGYVEVTCPVSEYLMGRSGYRACPICGELSSLWDQKDKGSASAAEAYKKFKRKFKGYAVVYVVNDSDKGDENNGEFKIVYINAIINKYLRKKIKGVDHKGNKIDGAVALGFKAFNQKGRDLIITVTQGAEFKEYECEFDEGNTLDITDEQIEAAYDTLDFESFYTKHDPAALQSFYDDIVLEKEAAPASANAAIDMAAEAKAEKPAEKAEKKTAKKAEKKVEKPAEKEAAPEEKTTGKSVDVDALLAGLPG